MNVNSELIENAIDYVEEALRADKLVTEVAHFHVSDGAFKEISQKAKEAAEEAIRRLDLVPPAGKSGVWDYRGYFTGSYLTGEKNKDVSGSLLHVCIFEVARGTFRRPEPLEVPMGEFTSFFAEPSDDVKAEHKFRTDFADWLEKMSQYRRWDAMP